MNRVAAEEIRRNLTDPARLVGMLGLGEGATRQARGLLVRCPLHADNTASCSVRLASDGTIAVKCMAGCSFGGRNGGGDALALIAAVNRLDVRRDFPRVLEIAAELAGVRLDGHAPRLPAPRMQPQPQPKPVRRPPADELRALWDAAVLPERTQVFPHPSDLAVCWFLAKRRFFPPRLARLGIVRVLPLPEDYDWPKWWPKAWADAWRLAVLAYEPDGTPASIHARAVYPDTTTKTRWPLDCKAAGLLFADTLGVELLRGQTQSIEAVVIVEGLTDLIAMALTVAETGRRNAVLGATAGGFTALSRVSWPKGCPAIVATDLDHTGDKYAVEIQSVLQARDVEVKRWNLAKDDE